MSLSRDYFARMHEAFEAMVCDAHGEAMECEAFLAEVISVFLRKRAEGRMAYFIGNGGSAGIAMHMTNDFLKNGNMKTHSMHDAATMTCLANDFSYEDVFAQQVSRIAEAGDLLVAISSSGNSENIVRAIRAAKDKDCDVLTLSGFGADNQIRTMGGYNLYVPCREYGIVESLHNAILQRIVDGMIEADGRQA